MSTAVTTPKSLGEYLYDLGYRDTLARYKVDGQFHTSKFNPAVELPDMYVIDGAGRASINPEYPIAHRARYGFTDDETNGNRVGERLPDFLSEIYPWMERAGISRSRQYQDQKDLYFVSRAFTPAYDELTREISPEPVKPDTGSGTGTGSTGTGTAIDIALRSSLKSILSRYKPPVRGGGAPTAKWREFWNAVSAELEKK